MHPEDFRRAAHELVDWIAAYRERTPSLPVWSRVEPGSVRAQLPAEPPEQPEPFAAIVADLERIMMPALSHWQHPRFFGYFPANANLASVLGELASAGLGQLGLNWQASPALTELEEQMCLWMRHLLGLSANWHGVIQDTASSATLVALICARERLTSYAASRGGLQAEELPLTVYCSGQSHSSVEKAALLAGFGRANLRPIETDETYALRPDLLAEALANDLAKGYRPCAVVATIGTTVSTALDPLAEIAALCRQHGLWLHVDAAMAGSAMILPECRWMWEGIEQADSLVLNPHKWLGVVFDCSLYYVRDPQHLVRVMSTNPSYLQTSADGTVTNYRDWGIPLGRRMRALKLWFMLRLEGAEALRTRLRRDLALAQWLAAQVDATPNWVRLNPVHLQTVCIRHEPPGLEGEELDRHTLAWIGQINNSGVALLTPAVLDGRWMCRVSLGAETTSQEDVAHLWATLRQIEA
ncbi:pyridoxal phosphate-dependent decarboxylase family protein [Candidatus Viridilinea mediisalina]|uniref:Aspartate aminotransferase family protein n=1 Tax=Candidatus Viridilinea mediisalina TaxID=2024553 RepID=A0A2A6RMV0_9CHLR|nr:pyridoxal-dependent decarboxylase [Candidatus Viridilinea mediisalina]PDW04392.1 aspartate aminotransferase family protein [Candidatus Viridilinea mediisalina]